MIRRLLAVLLAAALPVILLVAPEATAATVPTGSCTGQSGSPTCYIWTGRVVAVQDGDTLDVDVWGDGTSTPKRVRVTGIQAMEQSVYSSVPARRRGECHALEATARFEQLARRGQVIRVLAQNPNSTTGGRLRRSVAVQIGGQWQDVGRILVREGHALTLSDGAEYAWNATYRAEAKRAANAGVGLWDNDYCGSGNNQGSRLMMMVNWDAEGDDSRNLNGEWVRLRNLNYSTPISVSGWWLRDSDLRRFTFPLGTTIPAGGSIDVFVGSGRNTSSRFYWGQTSPVFDNVSHDARALGDGAYLFDRQGDLRWSMTYPCVNGCASPLQDKVNITAQPSGTEYVDIKNTSSGTIDLMGHLLVNLPYSYAFRSSHRLDPNQALRIYTGRGTGAGLVRYWGKTGPILNNSGETVSLRTYDDIEVDCFQWGTGRC